MINAWWLKKEINPLVKKQIEQTNKMLSIEKEITKRKQNENSISSNQR